MFIHGGQGGQHQLEGGVDAVGIGFQHMRLTEHTDPLTQGIVAGAVTRTIHETRKALLRDMVQGLEVRAHEVTALLHPFLLTGHQPVVHESTQVGVELVRMGHQQFHHVLVIGSVAHVCFEIDVGIPLVQGFDQRAGVAGIGLDEVAVEIEVACISAEAILRRTILVDSGCAVALARTAHVVDRHDAQRVVRQQAHVLVTIQ